MSTNCVSARMRALVVWSCLIRKSLSWRHTTWYVQSPYQVRLVFMCLFVSNLRLTRCLAIFLSQYVSLLNLKTRISLFFFKKVANFGTCVPIQTVCWLKWVDIYVKTLFNLENCVCDKFNLLNYILWTCVMHIWISGFKCNSLLRVCTEFKLNRTFHHCFLKLKLNIYSWSV